MKEDTLEARTRSVVDISTARNIVVHAILPVEKEHAGIINAAGKTVAEDIKTETPVPQWNTAAIDGYAAMSEDTQGAVNSSPATLSVLADSANPRSKHLMQGTAVRVRAGDPLPEGADTVITVKDTYRPQGGPELLVLTEYKQGDNVTPAGSKINSGEMVIKQGAVINHAEMALLASLGLPGVPVRRKPKAAIITTGNHVADIIEEMKPGGTRNDMRYALVGMMLESGCDLGRLIHVREGRAGIEKAVADCAGSDAVIIALAPGEKHDTALHALRNIGNIYFERIQMEPGSAVAFGTVEGRPVFILPGDALLEAYEAVLRPGFLTLLGRVNIDRIRIKAELGSLLKLNPGCSHLIKATLTSDNGRLLVKPLTTHSHNTPPWMLPNSLIVIEGNTEMVKRGEEVDVLVIKQS